MQPPIYWVQGAISQGVKRPGRQADHSPPSSAEVKNGGAIPPLPPCLHGIVLNYLTTGTTLFSIYVLVFLVVFSLLAFPPKTYMHSFSPYECYLACPAHPP
jgi:hypothetical protein